MNCKNTYYFIDDFNQICKQKKGVQKEFSEILELQNLIDDINEIIDENEQLKQRNEFLKKQLDRVCDENEIMGDKLKQIGRML
jgi:cell division septum initiation protein DivIVA